MEIILVRGGVCAAITLAVARIWGISQIIGARRNWPLLAVRGARCRALSASLAGWCPVPACNSIALPPMRLPAPASSCTSPGHLLVHASRLRLQAQRAEQYSAQG